MKVLFQFNHASSSCNSLLDTGILRPEPSPSLQGHPEHAVPKCGVTANTATKIGEKGNHLSKPDLEIQTYQPNFKINKHSDVHLRAITPVFIPALEVILRT